MTIQNSRRFKIAISILAIMALVVLLAQWKAKYMIENFLERKIPSHLVLTYSDFDVNILTGNVGFNDVAIAIKNRDSLQAHTLLKLESLEMNGLDYAQLLLNNTIALNAMILVKPELKYYPYKYIPTKKTNTKEVANLLKTISVKKLDVKNGSLYIMKDALDSIQLSIVTYNFFMYGGKTDQKLINQKIPLKYDSYQLKAINIFADLGKYEILKIAQLTTSERELTLKKVHLSSKYGKQELSKYLMVERDYVDLIIPQVKLNQFDFGFDQDRLEIGVASLNLERPRAEIYRDKLVEDDLRIKPLYGKLLRELPMTISVGQIWVDNGYLVYEEKIENDQDAGKLTFEEINAELNGVSNRKNAQETEIVAHAKLMGQADFKLKWDFNVNDNTDAFNASGVLQNLQAAQLNLFLMPNLRVQAKGSIKEMYFTLSGNAATSKGDMKMKYQDFKFDVLDKDRLKINKFLTTLGAIFVNDGSKTDAEGFRYGTMEVERETNKSFYNYLWQNVRSGMVSTLTGNGKKID